MLAESLALALPLIALGFVAYRRKEPASVEAPVAVVREAPVDDQEDEAKLSARRAQSHGLEVQHADEVVHALRSAREVEQALTRARAELDQTHEEFHACETWWYMGYRMMEASGRDCIRGCMQNASSDWIKYQGWRIEQLEAALAARSALEQALPARRSPMEPVVVSSSERARIEARFVARDAEAKLVCTLREALDKAEMFEQFVASERSSIQHWRKEAVKQGMRKDFESWRADERERARELQRAIEERDRRWRAEKRRSRRARNAVLVPVEMANTGRVV